MLLNRKLNHRRSDEGDFVGGAFVDGEVDRLDWRLADIADGQLRADLDQLRGQVDGSVDVGHDDVLADGFQGEGAGDGEQQQQGPDQHFAPN